MIYKPLHCWDCGTRVIDGENGSYTLQTNFRHVRFGLSDGSYCESPFCEQCAQAPWTIRRIRDFEEAVNRVDPRHQIHILTVAGMNRPRDTVVSVLEPLQATNLNRV